jgi:hypothetical protein
MDKNYYEEDYENPEDICEIGCEPEVNSDENDELAFDGEEVQSDLY